ncbi:MAG: tetratricopeptide repeat protein [Victivallales bacterium]|nr:tetratricopeptide repeat protein [Victivallales bacterium]
MKKIFAIAILCAICSAFAAESYSALLKQAGELAKAQKYDEAGQIYRNAAAVAKNSDEAATALYRRADMLKQQKRYDEAVAAFEEILAVKNLPRHNQGTAWRALAQLMMLQGKTRDAVRCYKSAGSVNAGTWIDNVANSELAKVCEKLGWYEDALAAHKACLQAAKCSDDGKAAAYAGMVLALAKLNRLQEAHETLDKLKSFAKDLGSPSAVINCGMAEAQLADAEKDWSHAIECYRRVMTLPKVHYLQCRAAGNRAAQIALHEIRNVELARSIAEELRSLDKYGVKEELMREIKKGEKK